MARLQEQYKKKIVPALMKEFSYKNAMEVPKLEKITLNRGVGTQDKKKIALAVEELKLISGQKPVVTRAVNQSRVLKFVRVGL